MDPSAKRVYAGVHGVDRQAERRAQLIEAGLDLLGAADAEGPISVRAVCKQSGLAARYFYESFTDRDAFAVAVFDHVVGEVATSTLQAVEFAPAEARAKVEAGLGNIVRTVEKDPRVGRLLYAAPITSTPLARRRLESARLFASLLDGQARDFYRYAESPELELASQFIVGGFSQTMTAWLDGTVGLTDRRLLVQRCTDIFLAIADTPAFRGEPTDRGAQDR